MAQSNEWTTERKKKNEKKKKYTDNDYNEAVDKDRPTSLDIRTCSTTAPDKRESFPLY